MKSRFFFLTLCLAFSLATFAPVSAEEKAADSRIQSAMAKLTIPAVPDSESVEDYQKYINYQKEAFSIKIQDLILQARNSGVNIQSAEFFNSLKEKAKEYYAHIEQAADKALALKDVSDENFEELVETKIQLIEELTQLSNEEIDVQNAKLEAFAAQLRKMGKEKFVENVENILFKNKVQNCVQTENVEEFKKLADDVFEKVEKAGKDIAPNLAKRAMLIVFSSTLLSEYNAPEGRQEKLYKALTEASDPKVNKLADELENTIRRIEAEKRFNNALGKEFKFGGTFTDGSEYKAEDYAGKVVLIDFWATWCGPCRAELPNVKKMYKAYRDKGFEVIGVTCDDPKAEEDLNKFLKDNDISWKQMFDVKAVVPGEKTKDGKPVTVSDYYSINAIPCPVLIGKDGNVVSLNARGEELEQQLVKIFGEVEGLDADDKDEEVEEVEESKELNDEDKPQADNDVIPAVPQNSSNDELEKYVNNLEKQAQKEGIYLQYGQYEYTQRERAKEYYNHVLQAMDEAVLLKDTDERNYELLVQDKIIVLGFLAKLNNENEEKLIAKLNEFKNQLRQINKPNCADIVEFKIIKMNLEKLAEQRRDNVANVLNKARKNGFDENSPEFNNLINAGTDECFDQTEQLMDKALLLKHEPDNDFKGMVFDKLDLLTYRADFQKEDIVTVFSRMKPVIAQLRQMGRTECADSLEIIVIDRSISLFEKTDDFAKVADELDQMIENVGNEISNELSEAVINLVMNASKCKYKIPEERLVKYAKAFSDTHNWQVKSNGDKLQISIFDYKVDLFIQNGNVEEFSKLAAEMDEKVEKVGKDISFALASQAKTILLAGYKLPGYKVPQDRDDKYLNAFKEASDGNINMLVKRLKHELLKAKNQKRFNDTIGNEFKLGGTFIDGSAYKAEDYAGKVVLINFWASWCRECRSELQNIKKMYDAYHDKGFEIIGIANNQPEEEDINKFLEDNNIPWKQMFDEKAVVPGEKNKYGKPVTVSEYYEIYGFPVKLVVTVAKGRKAIPNHLAHHNPICRSSVLIGADGKVISINVLGEELEQQLGKFFSEVEDLDADDANADKSEDANDENKTQAANDPLPAVPQNATYAELKKYVRDLDNKARKEGLFLHSDEFKDSQTERAKEYFNLIIQAINEAFLFKDVDEDEYESLVNDKIEVLGIIAKLNNDNEETFNAKLNEFKKQLCQINRANYADLVEFQIVKKNLEKLVNEMREKIKPILAKIKEDGIDENSPEYVNLLKGIVDEYFGPAEQLMDKALLLKYTPDRDFEDIVSEKLSMLISLAHFKNEDLTTVFSRMQPVIDQLRQLGRTECADFIEIKVLDRIFILTENADAFTKAADKLDQMVEKAGKNISWEMANTVMGMISYSRKHNYSVPEERLTKYANAFSESSNMIVKRFGNSLKNQLFENTVNSYMQNGNVEEFSKLAAEMDEAVEKAGNDISELLANQAKAILINGYKLPGYKVPKEREEKYLNAFNEAFDGDIRRLVGELKNELIKVKAQKKFYDALGAEFKFGGTFTDGSEYKAEDYAGKVVLIDFWATWCGPCRRELTNVKKMYDAYHDKGFEVIGVTCDKPNEEEEFNKFLKENDIPWKQMFDKKAVVPGEKTEDGKPVTVSQYYGINAIPCPVLIGKDGKVVSLNARGDELKEQLVRIYGEVEEKPAAPAKQDKE